MLFLLEVISFIIIYKEMFLDCDWSISVELIPNRSGKLYKHLKILPQTVVKLINNSQKHKRNRERREICICNTYFFCLHRHKIGEFHRRFTTIASVLCQYTTLAFGLWCEKYIWLAQNTTEIQTSQSPSAIFEIILEYGNLIKKTQPWLRKFGRWRVY